MNYYDRYIFGEKVLNNTRTWDTTRYPDFSPSVPTQFARSRL